MGVVLLGVHIGLYIGIVFSLFSVIVKTQNPYTALIARVKGTDIYRDETGIKMVSIVHIMCGDGVIMVIERLYGTLKESMTCKLE